MRFVIISLLFFAFTSIIVPQQPDTRIIPAPRIVNKLQGTFTLPKKVSIVLTGSNTADSRFIAQEIAAALQKSNGVESAIQDGKPAKNSIVLSLHDAANKDYKVPYENDPEGYLLRISKDGILISSTTHKGLFYGAMSLVQLLERSSSLQAMEIEDWPDLKVRGISDDISRGQVSTLANFKRIISFMARYKMNTFMPYIEDMLELQSYPLIGRGRGALTKDEVRELVSYARERYIDIVPVFQTLGHFENILVQPEFLKYAEFKGAASLNVSYDSTYIMLQNMLEEIAQLFPSEYMHIGADESYDVGLGKSSHLVQASGIAQVHLQHYLKVYDIVKGLGKKVIMYGDIILNHPEILDGLPRDITIVDWHYRPDYDYPSARTFKEAGHQYYVSPTVWNFQTSFPTNVNALANTKYITRAGLDNGASGMISSNWGDFGAEQLKELILPGYAYAAQCAWNYKNSSEYRFMTDFLYDFYGVDDARAFYIYQTLGNPLNEVVWHDLWRHPLLPFRTPNWWDAGIYPITRTSNFETLLPRLSEDISALSQSVRKNQDQLSILQLVVDLSGFYKEKLLTQYLLQEFNAGRNKNTADLNNRLENHIQTLDALKKRYRSAWTAYYKPEGFELVEAKFDRLASYFEEIRRDLRQGKLGTGLLESKWIYCPVNDTALARSARFMKEFTLSAPPAQGLLQLIGDTWARVYVNGTFAGEVYARRTLSLRVDMERVKMFDISKYLRQGTNTITVECDNYNNKGAAGFNVIARVSAGKDTLDILSDKSWSAVPVEKNKEEAEQKTGWKTAVERNYPFVITAPDFDTKRTSWIER